MKTAKEIRAMLRDASAINRNVYVTLRHEDFGRRIIDVKSVHGSVMVQYLQSGTWATLPFSALVNVG